MNQNSNYFKSYQTLRSFFSDDEAITVTGIRDFCRTRGMMLFAQERQGIPELPSQLLYGIESLRHMSRYINAQPWAMTGFIARQNQQQITMFDQPFVEMLDTFQDKSLREDGLELRQLEVTTDKTIKGKIRYYRDVAKVDTLIGAERIQEEAIFFGSKVGAAEWIIFILLQKVRDFRAALEAIRAILTRHESLQWNLELISLDRFQDTEVRHMIIRNFIDKLSNKYRCLGIKGFAGKRDFTLETSRLFDAAKDIRQATLHQLYPVDMALEEVRQEGAYARSLELILTRGQELFVVELKGKTDRMEVSLVEKKDIKGADLDQLKNAQDIKSLQTVYIINEERIEITQEIWYLFFSSFKEYLK